MILSGVAPYKRVDGLRHGRRQKREKVNFVHIRKFPKGHEVKLFRLASGSGRTEYIATHDLSQSDADATKRECRVRWKIEQLHRELKQSTGIGKCQSRLHRGQRNHIACCFWVWVALRRAARRSGSNHLPT